MVGRGASGIAFIALAVVVLIVAVPLLIPSLNPFKEETVDRSQPVLLRSLERLSEYRAATANLQVVVDVEQDTKLLPDFIKGERTLLVAAGNVDAAVDFRGLGGDDVQVNDDRTSVTIDLPAPTLSDARVDLARTRVFDTDRGLLDRVGDAFGNGDPDEERKLLALAERKLAEGARANAGLLRAAERNTRSMLEGLLRGLGFEQITIRFARPAEPAT